MSREREIQNLTDFAQFCDFNILLLIFTRAYIFHVFISWYFPNMQ